tara:strand:+ start:3238 stop:3546 length:309 start_codon:yes stop_codon:yes gene_type:complete
MSIDKQAVYVERVLQKKSTHFSMTTDVHTGFKVACALRSLSMQEVIEEFASLISQGNTGMLKLLDRIQEENLMGIKKEKKMKIREVNDIYTILEQESPLRDE